jgi:hypothetical protein
MLVSSLLAKLHRSCSNPVCAEQFDSDKAQSQINKHGLVYADCGELIIQGFKCPSEDCNGYQLIYSRPDEPAFDMRGFIISPHNNPIAQVIEQIALKENQSEVHNLLNFKFIPAWDEQVPFTIIENKYRNWREGFENNIFGRRDPILGIPYKLKEVEFDKRLIAELETGQFHLRRLYPDTLKFRSLLNCVAPNKITRIEDSGEGQLEEYVEGSSAEEISELKESLCKLLEYSAGITFREAVQKWINSKVIFELDEKELNIHLYKALDYREEILDKIRTLSSQTNFLDQVDKYLAPFFQIILNPICTEVALSGYRKELTKWVDKVEKGKALFVDAPMGLGKTHSIVEALGENQNLSAIIFMPTIKLCEEIVQSLKAKIAWNSDNFLKISENIEIVKDSKGNDKVDSDGYPIKMFKRGFLENEVYYAEGINPDECPFYEKFKDRYSYGWFTKKTICAKCSNFLKKDTGKIACRFRKHYQEAPLSRIVVATHMHYDRFCKQATLRKWYKEGYYKKDASGKIIFGENGKPLKADGLERSFFIIDEDIILDHCYKPKGLKKSQLKAFIATITDFLTDLPDEDNIKVDQTSIISINEILAQFEKCDKTSIVPPINKGFKISRKIKDIWEKEYSNSNQPIPEFLNDSVIVGNHFDFIEHAIKYGFVVQNYQRQVGLNGSEITNKIKKAYLPNPATMDLTRLPPHVFFDGTKIDEKFIKHKLKNIKKVESYEIKIKPLWKYRIFQNTNTDLPTTKISTHKPIVECLLTKIFYELGPEQRYYIISSKQNRDAYLEKFINTNFSNYKYLIGHYGNIKGINDAKDCNVAIMLGSFIPSDAVEIAMGLEFIQNKLKPNKILPTKNNIWSIGESNYRRIYKADFSEIGELAKINRDSEHRQALARTRYLFHDVDFYVLSKYPIISSESSKSYEPFFTDSETHQFATDLFPKKERSDSLYLEIRQKILRLLDQNGKLREMDLHDITGHHRETLSKHLERMIGDNCVVRCGKSYSLPPKPKIEQATLYN